MKAAARVLAGYHLTRWTPNRSNRVDRSQSACRDIPYGVRRLLLDWSRDMERRDPLFNRYLDLCEQYMVGARGLIIRSASQNEPWAARANAAWDGWQPWHDVSSRFSFGKRQALIVRELRVAGELFIIKTTGDPDDRGRPRPRLQYVESENCFTPPDLQSEEGKTVFDGVRRASSGRPIGYFFQEIIDGKQAFRETPASNVIHCFDPSRFGQSRGLPIFYSAVKDLLDLSELQDLEMVSAKDNARISRVVTTPTGEIDDEATLRNGTDVLAAGSTNPGDYYEQVSGVRPIITMPGHTYAEYRTERPTASAMSFWDFVNARAAAGLGLPYEILIMKSMQGTVARGAYSMADAFFCAGTASLMDDVAQVWEFAIGMDPATVAGRPPDWRAIKYTRPRSINVDVGRNSAAMVAELEAGTRTFEQVYAEMGMDWRECFRQRGIEARYALDVSEEFDVPVSMISQTLADKSSPGAAEFGPEEMEEEEPETETEET